MNPLSLRDVADIVGVSTGLISLAGFIWLAATKIARLEMRMDTVWKFIIERALVEGLEKGVLSRNSPLTVTDKARECIEPIAPKLREFYRRKGRRLTDARLMEAIERHFGAEIVKYVCEPLGVYSGSCLLIAALVAKEP